MAGNNRQKKSSSGPFSLFNIFKGKSSRGRRAAEDTFPPDSLKAYKVWPSDQDEGRYVADPGIDKKASLYISAMKKKWGWGNEAGPTT